VTQGSSSIGEAVHFWYRCYCGLVIFLIGFVAPILLLTAAGSSPDPFPLGGIGDPQIDQIFGEMRDQQRAERTAKLTQACILCAAICAPFVLALALKPGPGSWVYHIFMLCFGLSGCTLPFSVILLIYWFRPETQAFFGRGQPPATASSPPVPH
jgi:hypothetical protein